MATKKTIEKIQEDSCSSIMQKTTAAAINTTRKKNGHIDRTQAINLTMIDCDIPETEATQYVAMVIDMANDIE